MSRIVLATLLTGLTSVVTMADTAHPVVAEGLVPDEATRADVLRRLRLAYPETPVIDRIEVGSADTPANWSRYISQAIGANLRHIQAGELLVEGNSVKLTGKVRNEAIRDAVSTDLKSAFNQTYRVTSMLAIDDGATDQAVLDGALGAQTISFESGSAVLTPTGMAVLDQMATAIAKVGTSVLDIIGHTDAAGDRQTNILLSMARADAVKAYLVSKGIAAERLVVSGRGPDQPIADNATTLGRSRNRRIEFTIRR